MKILILGDSHSKLLNVTNELKDCFPNCRGVTTKVLSLSGATINGFGKRESTLNSQQQFIETFYDFKPNYICFALGQVDIELGFYYKTIVQDQKINADDYIKKLAKSYFDNIHSTCERLAFPLSHVIIKGINLSTLSESRNKAVLYTSRIINENITNKEKQQEYNQKLKSELPTNIIRNKNHLFFNEVLKNHAYEKNISYFDINKEISDSFTGNIKKEFIPAFNDHHLVDSLFIRELHIQKLLSSIIKV